MANKDAKYWEKRFEQILIDNEKHAVDYEKEMAKIYEEVKQSTQKELEAFYQRYSNETGLSLADVRKRLDPKQLKKFKVQQQKYLDEVNKLIEQGASLEAYAEKLKELSARAYVTKLQEIQNNLNSEIMILNGQQEVKLTNVLNNAYLEGYFKTMYEVQKGIGMGYSFTVPNTDDVKKILATPWNGNQYSKSIWKNKGKLTNWLNTDLARHFASGSSAQQMSDDLSKKLTTNYKDAIRLVRTEVNHISNQSTMDSYENSGVVDQYQILATLDSRTSETCRDMDGKIFNLSEKKVAVNMPPFHVNCRTTTVPYFGDEDFEDVERAARDGNGKYYTVPADMSYREWQDKHGQGAKVDKQNKTVIPKELEVKPVQVQEEPIEERQYLDLEQEDIDKWSDEVVPNLTKEQIKAVENYTSEGAYTLNAQLRGKYEEDEYSTKFANTLRSAMHEMPQDTNLYRVMNKYDFLKTFNNESIMELQHVNQEIVWNGFLGGKLFKDKAFQSTSWTLKSSYIDSRSGDTSVIFKIKTPKGTKALPVEKISSISGENEIILNTGNTYVITGVKSIDGQTFIECLLHEEL